MSKNSRLIHAAARGAKWQAQKHPGVWVDYPDARVIQIQANPQNFRIHPDDAAKAYGPISTALREFATTLDYVDWTPAYEYTKARFPELSALPGSPEDFLMTLLFCAEALADEGL